MKKISIIIVIISFLIIAVILSSCNFSTIKLSKEDEKNPFFDTSCDLVLKENVEFFIDNNTKEKIKNNFVDNITEFISLMGNNNLNYKFIISESIDDIKKSVNLEEEYIFLSSKEYNYIYSYIYNSLEKTKVSEYVYLNIGLSSYFTSNIFEEFPYKKEGVLKDVNPTILTLNGIFLFKDLVSEKDIESYKSISESFTDYLITNNNSNFVKEIINNIDNWKFLTKEYEKFLLENKNFGFKEKFELSNFLYIKQGNLITTHTKNGNQINFYLNSFSEEFTIYDYCFFINSIDEKQNKILKFLKQYEENINPNKRLTLYLDPKSKTSTASNGNVILLVPRYASMVLIHEMTHVYLTQHSELPVSVNSKEFFSNTYEEGVAEYIKYFVDDYYINSINVFYKEVNKDVLQSYDTDLLIYEKVKENNGITSQELIDFYAYHSLTDKEFLKNTNLFNNYENIALKNYEEAASFVTYIINTYGYNSFAKIRSRKFSYQEVFNKNYLDIIDEWLIYLNLSREEVNLNFIEYGNIYIIK